MMPSNGNIFHITGSLCREFTGHRWIPLTKASDTEFWCFIYLRLTKQSKQSKNWWFETSSRSLWSNCNDSFTGRGQSYKCLNVSEETQKNMGKWVLWIPRWNYKDETCFITVTYKLHVVSNRWQLECLRNGLSNLTANESSKPSIAGCLWGESSGRRWISVTESQ